MAFSGTISATAFNTNRVIDAAFRRCRVPAQAITAEMQQDAKDSLYLLLSTIGNERTPSWCIDTKAYAMVEGQAQLNLDLGTVSVLNANYRVTQPVVPATTTPIGNTIVYDFSSATSISTVGLVSNGSASSITLQTSSDSVSWSDVGAAAIGAVSGVRVWADTSPVRAARYFRLSGSAPISLSAVNFGTSPQEIPLSPLNRDEYIDQSNKSFLGRPSTYWFQRDLPRPVMNLWPAPNGAAELAQVVVTRHRHIMDVGTLSQEIEVPQRWLEAVVSMLAERVGMETPSVDMNLLPMLSAKAAAALAFAWAGDSDGSSTQINVGIGCYTR